MSVRSFAWVPLLLLFALATGCSEAPNRSLTITWTSDELAQKAAVMELSLMSACGGQALGVTPEDGTVIKQWSLSRGKVPSLGDLRTGKKALYARAYNAQCELVAAGCVDFTLAKDRGTSINLLLSKASCPSGSECTTDVCGGLPQDASMHDSGDACSGQGCGMDDASTPTDAGQDSGLPEQIQSSTWTANFSNGCPFDLYNAVDSTAAQCDVAGLQVVTAEQFARGGGYKKGNVTLNANTSFDVTFTLYIDNVLNAGMSWPPADGTNFVILNAASSNKLGHPSGLGYAASPVGVEPMAPAVAPSVAVEFDYFDNGDQVEPVAGSHLALVKNGLNATPQAHLASGYFGIPIGVPLYVWVHYDGRTNDFTVWASQTNAKPIIPEWTKDIDIPTILGSNQALFGFVAGTGQFAARVHVLAMSVVTFDDP